MSSFLLYGNVHKNATIAFSIITIKKALFVRGLLINCDGLLNKEVGVKFVTS